MRVRRFMVACALLCAAGCDTPCAFRIVTRIELGGQRVACCGAADYQDVTLPDQPDLAIDLSQVALPGQAGGQDLWLTTIDCQQLFDGAYAAPGTGPRPSPKCPALVGPVAPGRVSPRTVVPPGRYRVFVQAYSTNTTVNDYHVDISLWGSLCDGSPVRP